MVNLFAGCVSVCVCVCAWAMPMHFANVLGCLSASKIFVKFIVLLECGLELYATIVVQPKVHYGATLSFRRWSFAELNWVFQRPIFMSVTVRRFVKYVSYAKSCGRHSCHSCRVSLLVYASSLFWLYKVEPEPNNRNRNIIIIKHCVGLRLTIGQHRTADCMA